MKRTVMVALVFSLFLLGPAAIYASEAVKISDLTITDGLPIKAGQTKDITFRFLSNQKPDEVVVKFSAFLPGLMRNVTTTYSSKNGEVKVTITEKEGVYEILAVRALRTPNIPGKVDAAVMIKAGKESNWLEQQVSFD